MDFSAERTLAHLSLLSFPPDVGHSLGKLFRKMMRPGDSKEFRAAEDEWETHFNHPFDCIMDGGTIKQDTRKGQAIVFDHCISICDCTDTSKSLSRRLNVISPHAADCRNLCQVFDFEESKYLKVASAKKTKKCLLPKPQWLMWLM